MSTSKELKNLRKLNNHVKKVERRSKKAKKFLNKIARKNKF